jgi:pyruvyltransferase
LNIEFNKFFLFLIIIFSVHENDANEIRKELPLYFWDARPTQGFSNFGDALSEALTQRMVGHKVNVVENPFCSEKKLLGMGSILNYAQDDDIIWGTGVNGKTPLNSYVFKNLDVRAVRGPLTRKFLLERGIFCPEVYGDPTLLFPTLFPEFKKSESPTNDYVVVPHFSDEHLFLNDNHMISVREPWNVVIEKILDSKFVISSALSGIIIAEAFGIPARLLVIDNDSNTENLIKYADYYYGTNRFDFKYAKTIEEALKMEGEALPRCDLNKLYEAFPFEFF